MNNYLRGITVLWAFLLLCSISTANSFQDLVLVDNDPGFGWGLNNKGEVVGTLNVGQAAMFLPQPAYGLPAGVNPLPGESAYAINDRGQVLVLKTLDDGRAEAGIWLPQAFAGLENGVYPLPPTIPDHESQALDLNERGQVCGISGVI